MKLLGIKKRQERDAQRDAGELMGEAAGASKISNDDTHAVVVISPHLNNAILTHSLSG